MPSASASARGPMCNYSAPTPAALDGEVFRNCGRWANYSQAGFGICGIDLCQSLGDRPAQRFRGIQCPPLLHPAAHEQHYLDKDIDGWRPALGQLDKYGQLIDDRLFNQFDMDRNLVLDERTKLVAWKVTEYLKAYPYSQSRLCPGGHGG